MDEDLDALSPQALADEVRRLRRGIRQHRDASGHELCWHHPALWGLLPDKTDPVPTVPSWPEFLRGCVRYRQSLDLQAPSAPRSDVELEPRDRKLVVLGFNEAINRRDLEGLTALMTEDHAFVDTEGERIEGRQAVHGAWQRFFAAFPDYRNDLETVSSREDVVMALGRSSCSTAELAGPAIWRAVVRDDLVAEWRVFADSDETRRSLGLRTSS